MDLGSAPRLVLLAVSLAALGVGSVAGAGPFDTIDCEGNQLTLQHDPTAGADVGVEPYGELPPDQQALFDRLYQADEPIPLTDTRRAVVDRMPTVVEFQGTTYRVVVAHHDCTLEANLVLGGVLLVGAVVTGVIAFRRR